MSGTDNSPTGILDERLSLGAGFAAADRPHILGALSALTPHLSGWEHDQVDLEVSLKDSEGPDQKVTVQAWLGRRAHLVATSHERDLDHALAEVRRDLIRQIEEAELLPVLSTGVHDPTLGFTDAFFHTAAQLAAGGGGGRFRRRTGPRN